jgi:starch-binding outer membrane protein, SusD/RagB family
MSQNMIKSKYILMAVAAISLTGACKKFEIRPEGLVEEQFAINSERDVQHLLNATYSVLTSGNFYGGRLQYVSELMADRGDGTALQSYEADIYYLRSNPDDGTGGIYAEPYVAIQRANTVLENMDKVSAANKDRFEGESKFLRAICHWELVKLFGQPYGFSPNNTHPGIIIKTTAAFEANRSRNTVKEVYDAIISDLMRAQAILPNTASAYPTRWSARAYLAKVYFQMNRFDSAYKYANDVIANSGATFDNTANFVNNRFGIAPTTETLFGLIQDGTTGARFQGLRNFGNPNVNMNLPVYANVFSEGNSLTDRRKAWYKDSAGVKSVKKYFIERLTLPLAHITEMKLIRAESAGELSQNLSIAINDLNDIINRAYTAPATLPNNAPASLVISKAREQRRLELVYELGDRLQQIKRIGAKGEPSFSRSAPWNCNGMILVFPAAEVSVNPNFQPNPRGGCL